MLTTASSGRATRVAAVLSAALVVLATACALLAGAVVLAGPAAAIEDPRRPSAELTHGPSCGPGVVRVAVTNGTVPHRVALVFDGAVEQDFAVLAGGERAELISDDVDWGRTVDVSLAVTGAEGQAEGQVEDPVEFGTYTRPTAEDCAAISTGGGSGPAALPPATSSPSTGTTSPTSPPPAGTLDRAPSTAVPPAPAESTPSGPVGPPPPPSDDDLPTTPDGSASAASISPGGVVRVRATGFTPGEQVTVSLLGVDDPLTTVTAGGDGSVETVVQIPRSAAVGTATVRLVGGLSSASAGLQLEVAARTRPVAEPAGSLPAGAAGVALVAAAGMLGVTAARRSRADHSMPPR